MFAFSLWCGMANSLGNAYVKIRGDIEGLKGDLDKALNQIKSLEGKVETSSKNMTTSFGKIEGAINLMTKATVAFGVAAGALSVAKNFLDAGIAAESMAKGLSAAMGSAQAATEAQKFLRAESERLGLVFMDQVKSYTSLAAAARNTSLEGEQTQKIFTAVTTASTALGLSADQTSGALNAIQQMMSKGNVQAEELRGQLGERIPGAFKNAATAMGLTEVQMNKLLETGGVLATDMIPKLADVWINLYGDAATQAANLTQANLNRMSTAFTDLKVAIIDDFLPAISSAFEAITNLIRLFPNLSTAIGLARSGLISFGDIATANGKELNELVNKFDPLVIKIAAVKNKIDEIGKGPMSWAYQGQLQKLQDELKTLETQHQNVSLAAQGLASAKGVKADGWIGFYKGLEESSSKPLAKIAEAHETANKATGDHEKTILRAAETISNEYAKLTLSADEYAKMQVWQWYKKEAEQLGYVSEELQKTVELKLQEIEKTGEQAKAIQEAHDAFVKLTTSAIDYKLLELNKKFQEDTEKIGENADALRELGDVYRANKALLEYEKDPYPADIWPKHFAKKAELAETTETQIAQDAIDKQKKAADEVQKTYDKMWENIQDEFADSLYGMFDEGLDSWGDFFDNILDMFKKMLAEMVAAWAVNEIKNLLSGSSSGFSVGSLLSGGTSIASIFGGNNGEVGGASEVNGSGTGGAIGSVLSLASLAKTLYSLPSTISGWYTSLAEGASTAAEALAGLATTTTTATTSVGALSGAAELAGPTVGVGTSGTVGSSIGLSVSSMAAIAAFAYSWYSATQTDSQFDQFDMDALLRDQEAGKIQLDKATTDLYKSVLLLERFYINTPSMLTGTGEDDPWIKGQQELLKLTMAEYDNLMGKQKEFWDGVLRGDTGGGGTWGMGYDPVNGLNQAQIDLALKIGLEMVNDAALPLEQKLYQLGFIATQTGWESTATIGMIAALKDQGVPWEDLNQTMIDYGATDSDVYKRIYADYTGTSAFPTWDSLAAAMANEGADADVIKHVQGSYSGNLTLEQLEGILYLSGMSSESISRIIGSVDPSTAWSDLTIPVDAPDSIPLTLPEDLYGRATGGPVAAGQPYVIGEIGPELFVPQESGHVLSNANMRKLLGGGIRGLADGTTDPLPGTPEWWAKYPASESDVNGSTSTANKVSSAYENLAEWQAAYAIELEKMLGLNTEIGDSLADINDYYKEQIEIATELGATTEDLTKLEEDQAKARQKIIDDWAQSELEFYNEMMGLNTDLGSTLADIANHYDEATKNAIAAGATQEQINALIAAGVAVGQKAVDDWAKSVLAYYNDVMGYTNSLESALSLNNDQWEKFIAEANAAGASVEQLSALYAAQAATVAKITAQWAQNAIDPLLGVTKEIYNWAANLAGMTQQQIALNSLMVYRASKGFSAAGNSDIWNTSGMSSEQVKEYVTALAEYYQAVASGLQATYTALNNSRNQILADRDAIALANKTAAEQAEHFKQKTATGFYALANMASEDIPDAINQVHADLMSYYEAEQRVIKEKYDTEIAAIEQKHDVEIQNIEAIRDKLLALKYSGYNLALPTAKAISASQDYGTMFAAAQSGGAGGVSNYLSFVDTYLKSAQDAYKSSTTYQDIYAKVMADIASLDTSGGASIEDLTLQQTEEIERLNAAMEAELRALDDSVTEALEAMSRGLEMRIGEVANEIGSIYLLLAQTVAAAYQPTGATTDAASGSKVYSNGTPYGGYAEGGWPSGPDSGYLAMLHGEEVVLSKPRAMKGGMGDPEITSLLTALVAQGSRRQNVTLTLENGRALKGYIQATADELDQARIDKGIKNRNYR